MGYFGIPFRNGVPIGLGSIAGFGAPQEFSPSELFPSGTAGTWYDPSDLTTMFTTSPGTTPVAMPGQGSAVSVGLMLDKSAPVAATGNYSGFFSGYGANVADNAAFTLGSADFTIEFWVKASSVASRQYVFAQINNLGTTTTFSFGFEITAASKWLFLVASGSNTYNATSVASATANWTHIAAVRNGNTLTLYVNGSADGTANVTGVTINDSSELLKFGDYATTGASPYTGYISNFRIVKGAAVYTGNFTPPTAPLTAISGTSFLTFQNNYFKDNSTSALAVNVTTASANLLNPFDATAARTINNAIAINDSTARPELRARVNLLTYSEDLTNAAWTKQTGTSVNSTPVADPNGALKAWFVTGNGTSGIYQAIAGSLSLGQSVRSVYLRTQSGTATVGIKDPAVTQGTTTCNLTTTWQRFTLTETTTPTGGFVGGIWVFNIPASGIEIAWPDVRPANIGTAVPAYQRIADANTYDTAGFPLYLRFDGIDDGMYTPANLNLSATDKVGVFAGVRKLSDATGGQVLETSSDLNANNGTFLMAFPGNIGVIGPNMVLGLRGTASAFSDARTYTAPITGVLQASFDIAQAAVADEIKQRINGAVPTSISYLNPNAGTGNFGIYPLYIGSRANSSIWFQGQIYGLIVVGSAVSAGNISATESWMANKTGIAIP